MPKTSIRKALLLGLVLLAPGEADALCSDGRRPNVAEEFRTSTKVVVGKVIASENYSSVDAPEGIQGTRYTLRVIEAYKGRLDPTLRVTSENTSARFPFDQGQTYLLFVSSYGNEDGVDPCGNSGPIEEKARERDSVRRLSGSRIRP